jgi:hypothetical protein
MQCPGMRHRGFQLPFLRSCAMLNAWIYGLYRHIFAANGEMSEVLDRLFTLVTSMPSVLAASRCRATFPPPFL